jgi:hypothetical protein
MRTELRRRKEDEGAATMVARGEEGEGEDGAPAMQIR